MLISYLGVDFQCRGDRVYRLLDTSLTFFGVANEGDTLKCDCCTVPGCGRSLTLLGRYDISINSFAYRPNGDIWMFFFS